MSGPTKLVEPMALEQKIAQLHGAMETIDIYGLAAQAETQEAMDQLADLLFGVVNPSGKVPTTYPRSEADTLRRPPRAVSGHR